MEEEPVKEYSSRVRQIYLLMAVILLVSAAFFKNEVPFPVPLSVFMILLLVIFGGLTNPKLKWVMKMDFGVSILAFLVFGSYVMSAYGGKSALFFGASVALAILSILALYFNSESLRENLKPSSS